MGTFVKEALSFYLGHKAMGVVANTIISFFILLFIYIATEKIFNFRDFSNGFYTVPILGTHRSIVAGLIIFSQLVIGILLIIPVTQKRGLYATLALLLIFTIYLTYMVSFMDVLPCSCGGVSSALSWKEHIGLNVFLMFLAGFGILTNQ